MATDHLVTTLQAEPIIDHTTPIFERPAPSIEQEQVADDVFSREQEQFVAALLATQTGLALAHHIIQETFPNKTEQVVIPTRRRPDEEK